MKKTPDTYLANIRLYRGIAAPGSQHHVYPMGPGRPELEDNTDEERYEAAARADDLEAAFARDWPRQHAAHTPLLDSYKDDRQRAAARLRDMLTRAGDHGIPVADVLSSLPKLPVEQKVALLLRAPLTVRSSQGTDYVYLSA